MRRLLDIVDGILSGEDAPPAVGAVLGLVDAGLAAGEHAARAGTVDVQHLGVLAAQRQAVFAPDQGLSPIGGYRDAVGQREVNVIRGVGIDGDVAGFRQVPVVAVSPEPAAVETAPQSVESGGVDDVAITRIEGDGGERTVIVTDVTPRAGLMLVDAIVGGDLGPDGVVPVEVGAEIEVVRGGGGGESGGGEQAEQQEGGAGQEHERGEGWVHADYNRGSRQGWSSGIVKSVIWNLRPG